MWSLAGNGVGAVVMFSRVIGSIPFMAHREMSQFPMELRFFERKSYNTPDTVGSIFICGIRN